MKIFTLLLFQSLSLCSSKKSKHKWSDSNSKSIDYSDVGSSDSEDSSGIKIRVKALHLDNPTFYLKGTVRQRFAIETMYAQQTENVVCSPVLALFPLGKLVMGAKGPSKKELMNAVGISRMSVLKKIFIHIIKKLQSLSGVKLNIASRIYVSNNSEIQEEFLNSTKNVFISGVEKISFSEPEQAADEINKWVSQQTKGTNSSIISTEDIKPSEGIIGLLPESLILVNAINFTGKWLNPFAEVGIGVFHTPLGDKKTQFMRRSGSYIIGKSDILNARVISIPYEGMNSAFIIVLPSTRKSLSTLLSQIMKTPKLLIDALEDKKISRVNLIIPKFQIESTLDLKNLYEKVNVRQIFTDESGLTGIVKNKQVTVSKAVHKAVLVVHETGTEISTANVTNEMPVPRLINNIPKDIKDDIKISNIKHVLKKYMISNNLNKL